MGNAVVPAVSEHIGELIIAAEKSRTTQKPAA